MLIVDYDSELTQGFLLVFLFERPRADLGLVGIVMVLPGIIDLNVRPT